MERNAINYILKKGESSVSKLFILRYSKNDQAFNRYCVIISRKVDTKAVTRNKLRRQIYEAIRLTAQNLKPSESNLDIILIPKKSVKEKTFEAIQTDLREIIINHG